MATKAQTKAPTKTTKAPSKKVATKKPVESSTEPMYRMPKEVNEWIERASSIMNHQKGEIARLKDEIVELKAYKTWATHRILRSDHEEK
jgi:hypothetical protein